MLKMLDCKHWDVTMGSNNFFRKVIYYMSYAPTMQIITMSLRKSHENVSYGTTKLNLQRLNPIVMCAAQCFAKTIAHAIKLSLFYSVARL